MTRRAPRICACGRVVAAGVMCACQIKARNERKARADAQRPTARERGYNGRWEKARATYLLHHPVCSHQGCNEPATVVDHKTPHRGDQALFWDRSNWQGLCAHHHNGAKQSLERRGKPEMRNGR